MIEVREIQQVATDLGLQVQVVEKDYALGWLLAGIAQHPAIKDSWVFKGGTCLKKCYFETYRFSEDLDFTLKDSAHLDPAFLSKTFGEIGAWLYDQCGMQLPPNLFDFDVHPDPSKQYVLGKIGYIGPRQNPRGSIPKIKLDLTSKELLVMEPVLRDVYHPYSDAPADGIKARCYAYEEVFAEKIRALAERLRPRDLYDVIHLHRHRAPDCDRASLLATLEKKCQFKGIAVPTFASLQGHPERAALEVDWDQMLSHQLASLPTIQPFWSELSGFFDWLLAGKAQRVLPPMPTAAAAGSEAWTPPRAGLAFGISVPIERIRMAASNRVCVKLGYHGKERIVEPYSFRQSRDGNRLFIGFERDAAAIRSYSLSKIESVQVTNEPYSPRYPVEINIEGPLRMPGISRPRSTPPNPYGRPTYIVQCNLCSHQFKRESRSTNLRPHKDKAGYKCLGRVGFVIHTLY